MKKNTRVVHTPHSIIRCASLAMVAVGFLSSIVASAAPSPSPTFTNVAYGPHEPNKLDFWKAAGEGPRPVVVDIHGGGWTGGKRSANPRSLGLFLENGISVATIDYRLTTEAILPAPVHDAARAIQFLRTKAKEWDIRTDRIALAGSSAGACTAMWILYHDDLADPDATDPVLRESTRVCAAEIVNGQTAIDPMIIEPWLGPMGIEHRMIWSCVGGSSASDVKNNYNKYRALYNEFSPINHIDKNDPPLAMFYSLGASMPPKDVGHAIHHGMFGIKLKEIADAFGVKTYLNVAGKESKCPYKGPGPFLVYMLTK